jgi:hypothetical protein
MKVQISEIAFKNNTGEYLDIEVNNEDHYITLDLETSHKFSMDEKDFKIFVRKMQEVFKNFKQDKL